MSEAPGTRPGNTPAAPAARHVLAVYLLIALAVGGVFHGLVTDRYIIFGNDAVGDFYHWRLVLRRALLDSRLPEWNPYVFIGQPFVAATQSAVCYPLNLILYRFCSVPLGMNLEEILHLVWLGWGTAFLLGTMRTRPMGMLAGGLLAAFAPVATGQLVAGHLAQLAALAWIPWALAGVELLWSGRRLAGAVVLAPAVGMSFLAGHPQFTFYLLLGAGYWFLWRGLAVERAGRRAWLRAGAALVAALALGALLAAAQLVPTLGVASSLSRAGSDYDFVTRNSEPPVRWLGLLFPSPDRPAGLAANPPELNENLFAWWGAAWLLILLAIGYQRDRRAWGLALLAGLALLLAGGAYSHCFTFAFNWLPGFASFRMPSRILALVYLALAVAAGRAFAGEKLAAGRSLKTLLLALLGLGIVLALLAAAPDAAARWAFCIDGFQPGSVPVAAANNWKVVLRALLDWSYLMVAALLVWLWGNAHRPRLRLAVEAAVVLLVIAQAVPWTSNQLLYTGTDWLERPSPLVQALQVLCAPGYRYLVLDDVPLGSIQTVPLFNRGTDYRLRNFGGSDAVVLRGFQGLFNLTQGRPPEEKALVYWANRTDHFLLDFLAVRFVVSTRQPPGTVCRTAPGELDPVAGIYERPTARPLLDLPAEFAEDTEPWEGARPLDRLRDRRPDQPLTIVQPYPGRRLPVGPAGSIQFFGTEYGEGWAEARVVLTAPRVLTYAEQAGVVDTELRDADWDVLIDGRRDPAGPRLVNTAALGTVVPAGEHTVRFQYRGDHARVGRWISFFLGFLPWSALALVWVLRRRREQEGVA